MTTPHAPVLSVGMVGTAPPTHCGLATFTAALAASLRSEGCRVTVVRVVEGEPPRAVPAGRAEPPEVGTRWVQGDRASEAAARDLLARHDVVVLHHEYGIYGGPDGVDVLRLLEALAVPVLTVLHTVLEHPTPHQADVLRSVVAASAHVVTMSAAARERLVTRYDVPPTSVTVIPHGAVVPSHAAATSTGTGVRPVVLTWGLLGPGKGVEWVIDALPDLRDLHPRYLVTGETHPKVAARHGEAYRESLVLRAARRGVGDLVELDGSYLGPHALQARIACADVVVLPYDSRDQITSGVLVEAVAAGRPVVATAFPHAVELLTDGPGLLVPHADPAAIAAAVRRVLTEPRLAAELARSAHERSAALTWPAVARRYVSTLHHVGTLAAARLVSTP